LELPAALLGALWPLMLSRLETVTLPAGLGIMVLGTCGGGDRLAQHLGGGLGLRRL
jgi:hypothetical protein